MKKFLKLKVITTTGEGATLQTSMLGTEAGMIVPADSVITIDEETTYKMLYEAVYASYSFPLQSLFENTCLAFCPDGYASVNGVCLKCQSPCSTCRHEVTRCESCL